LGFGFGLHNFMLQRIGSQAASAGCGVKAPPATINVAANITAAPAVVRSPALAFFFRPLATSDVTTQRLIVAFHTIL